MSQYPFSTKSSKKSKPPRPPPALITSPLHERSACQQAIGKPLKKQEYMHILQGERIFIELYYQGRVVDTAYPEYINFMGGLLCKRLNPKLSVFITNLQPREIAPIKQRVGKVCPGCKIVSILWFQHCFQNKQKMPFQSYEIENQVERSDIRSRESAVEMDLCDFLENVCEDMENDFKEFFKSDKQRYFEEVPKNHNKSLEDLFPLMDFDLGPNLQKKNKPKNQNMKKKRKSVKPNQSEKNHGNVRQFQSMGPQMTERIEGDDDEEDDKQKKVDQKENRQENSSQINKNSKIIRLTTVQNVLTKYLDLQNDYLTQQKPPSNTYIKSKQTPLVSQNSHNNSKIAPSQNLPSKQTYNSIFSKKSMHSVLDQKRPREPQQQHRFTFTTMGTKYKDLHRKQQTRSIDPKFLEDTLSVINKSSQNTLLVITASSNTEKSMRQVNKDATHHSCIIFHIISYSHFAFISQRISKLADLLFLFNTKKGSDRAMLLNLTFQKSSFRVRPVNHRLIDQIIAYNNQIKNTQLRTPVKLNISNLRHARPISYQIQQNYIKGKRVALLNSDIPFSVQEKVIRQLGGEFVSRQSYLLNARVDLIVTDRMGCVQDKGAVTITEQNFWRKVVRLEGDTD